MSLIARIGAGLAFLTIVTAAYLGLATRSVTIQLDLPITGEEGFAVEVAASYVRNGKRELVPLFDEVIDGDTKIEVQLPFTAPWQFESLRTRIRHPHYRPSASYDMTNPHWRNTWVLATPELWSRSHDHYVVQPSEETTMAGLEHLRWIREVYAERVPPHIFVQEVRRAQLMLGSLAFARGKKDSGWEQTRRAAISELQGLNELLDATTYEPCPENYEPDPETPIVCGRTPGDVAWPE